MTDTQLAGISVEALTTAPSDAQAAAVAVEVLTSTPSDAVLAGLAVEVLTPSYPLKGRWGLSIAPGF